MKIGIDAKWYFEGPPSGKRVVRNLVDHILGLEDQNEYFIFLNAKHKEQSFPHKQTKTVTICYVWAGNNLLSNVFLLPFVSANYKLDAVLYQNFSSPFGKIIKIAYIHDVLFLSNPEYYTLYERLYFAPLRFLTKRATGVITVSEEEKKRLLKFSFAADAQKIAVVYHGVERSFSPKETYDSAYLKRIQGRFNLPDLFLLFVGRLNLRKNVDNLLRAMPLLQDKNIPLVIVGVDNWKKSNHLRIIEELGIEGRVLFTGAIFEELGVIYSLAKVFAFPSYAESFGLPPLEAMACGVPVVVSNTSSLPEICGSAGCYVNPNRPQEIADAIDSLLINEQLYGEKRRLGLVQAAKFTWEQAARLTIKYMESLA